jgi:hypothetical protein
MAAVASVTCLNLTWIKGSLGIPALCGIGHTLKARIQIDCLACTGKEPLSERKLGRNTADSGRNTHY